MNFKQSKCLRDYENVQEWADDVIPLDYHNFFIGYGDDKIEDVEGFVKGILNDSKCRFHVCQVSHDSHCDHDWDEVQLFTSRFRECRKCGERS